ncbi:EAL domain-containing protein [Methylophaga sp. OBS4]|uniref:EAL domain-containing protein n=1 Tax=Methylophaga sp. OBS4 TaxID=2991935 RepID=UPI002254E433|nr:EAL domain-containing protein [Methylophaga sp. OBS4]MCX4186671.1 EAL domain-containing protein [Methylophaga sp. OBS4]
MILSIFRQALQYRMGFARWLWLYSCVVIILIAAISITSWSGLSNLYNSIYEQSNIRNNKAIKITKISQLLNENYSLAISLNQPSQQRILPHDLLNNKNIISKINRNINKITKTIEDLIKTSQTKAEINLINEFQKRRKEWLKTLISSQRQDKAYITGSEFEIIQGDIRKNATATVESLYRIREFNDNKDAELLSQVDNNYKNTLVTLLTATLICIIAASLFSVSTINYIRTVVKRVIRFAETVSNGDWSNPINNNNEPGEIGILLTHLEQMRESLHSLFTQNKEVENKAKKLLLAVNQSNSTVLITDLNTKIIYVNEAFTQTTGYIPEEVIGKTPKILQSNKTPEYVYKDLWKNLSQGITWTGELVNRCKDGTLITESVKISPIKNISGETEGYMAVKDNITELKKAHQRIEKMAYCDALTELPNRHRFIEQLKTLLNNNNRNFSILFVDLNNFKRINDSKGHNIGDSVLKTVSHRLNECCKDQILVARVGGDEFVIISLFIEGLELTRLVNDLHHTLSIPVFIDEYQFIMSASIGISHFPEHGKTSQDILRRADIAMHQAKMNNLPYCIYNEDMESQLQRELLILQRLELALSTSEGINIHLQPQFSLKDNTLIGAEALLRWHDNILGNVSPAEFITLAENKGLIFKLDKWVIEHSLNYLFECNIIAKFSGRIAINISSQTLENPLFSIWMKDSIENNNIESKYIELEITETGLMNDPDKALQNILKLKSFGISVSIDDFGTGYSSLAYLRRFNADKLKIDKSFIDHITTSKTDQSIVMATIELAHNLGMKTLAEGIENEDQKQILDELGCDYAQGYYYAKPMPTNEFTDRYILNDKIITLTQ